MTDKQPYLKYLIHESKKVYKIWIIILAVIGTLIGLGTVVWYAKDGIVNFFTGIYSAITNVLSLIPWYGYVIFVLVAGSLVYAAIKCWVIRGENIWNFVIIISIIGMIIGGIMIYHDVVIVDKTTYIGILGCFPFSIGAASIFISFMER